MTDDLNLLSARQAAEAMGVGIATFHRKQAKGLGPVGIVYGKRVYWTRKGIADWENHEAPKDNQTLNPALR